MNIHPDVNTCMVPNRIAGLFYGPFTNEELVGEALALYRYEVVITTNFGFRIRNGKEAALDSRQEHIKKAVEGSLKRFGVETMLGWQAIWARFLRCEEAGMKAGVQLPVKEKNIYTNSIRE